MLKHNENIALWQILYGLSLMVFFFAFDVVDIFFYILEVLVCYILAPLVLIDAFLRLSDRPIFSESYMITYCAGVVLFCVPVVLLEGYIVYEMVTYHDAVIGIAYHVYAGILLLAFLELMQSYYSPHKQVTHLMAVVAWCCMVCSLAFIRVNWTLSLVFTLIYACYFMYLEGGSLFYKKR